MKNLCYFMLCFSLLMAASCKKNLSSNGGSWTFKSKTYHASFCSDILGALTASTGTSDPTGSLAFYFPNNSIVAGTYIATKQYSANPLLPNPVIVAPGYVYIQLTDSSISNFYQISGSTAPQVTVTINNGLATVTLPPVMMLNAQNLALPGGITGYPTGTDSSLVSGTIIQTPLN